VLHQRIHTHRERFVAVFAERPKARILLAASTEREWVARCLEALGHEVRHPRQSRWLDEWGRLKGGRSCHMRH
jgi:hypothetical protein